MKVQFKINTGISVCLLLAVVVMLSIGMGWGSGKIVAAAVYDKLTFPDQALEQAIRDAIGKPQDDIYAADLSRIEHNALSLQGVTDLSGLEKCTNLETLFIVDGPVSDLTPLRSLHNLHFLSLWSTSVTDLTPIAELENLQALMIYNNPLGSLPSFNIPDMEMLSIIKCEINDISALYNLGRLTSLCLAENKLRNISALAGMPYLESLTINANGISDIASLAGCVKLKTLNCAQNQIVDISTLANLTALAEVYLSQNRVEDISALQNLKTLKMLDLNNNHIQAISALASLNSFPGSSKDIDQQTGRYPELYSIDLKGNCIQDISPLLQNYGLRDPNRVTDISLEGNPLSTKSVQTIIPALKQFRVVIDY